VYIDDKEAEIFRRKCLEHGVKKIVLRKTSWCFTGYVEFDDKVYEIMLAKGSAHRYYYAKITYRSSEYLNCDYILYNPYGFFVFSQDLEDLAVKTVDKIKNILKNLSENIIEL
jgi:hypothetical protein